MCEALANLYIEMYGDRIEKEKQEAIDAATAEKDAIVAEKDARIAELEALLARQQNQP